VVVFTQHDPNVLLKQLRGQKIHRSEHLEIFSLAPSFLDAVASAADRNARLSLVRNEGELYVTLGAQRASKILGIFARLDRRDGKPQYLRHLPRIWRYLRRSLIHPALDDLKAWYDANVPPPQ